MNLSIFEGQQHTGLPARALACEPASPKMGTGKCSLCNSCAGFRDGQSGWCTCGHPANAHWD